MIHKLRSIFNRGEKKSRRQAVAFLGAILLCAGGATYTGTKAKLTRLSTDPFTNSTSQHKTEVEPDTFAWGSMIVTAFQSGRFYDGGSSDVGFATSADGGMTWKNGFLPGITNIQQQGNPYQRDTDPSVTYDAAHGVWLIASLPLQDGGLGVDVLVSSSTDGVNWGNPVHVTGPVDSSDKEWIVCDDWSSSPYYGHCYVEWDDPDQGDYVYMNTSTDGGNTWGPSMVPGSGVYGLGGQPLVQPNGNVVVPIYDYDFGGVGAFNSSNGGASWNGDVSVAAIDWHPENGGIRDIDLPSAEVDGAGTIFVAWEDCRFRSGCSANDIVYSTSSDGINWSNVNRVPIDPITSGKEHMIPGIGVDRNTSGNSALIGITYYSYPQANCSSCKLYAGFISSSDAGQSWSKPVTLSGPMELTWLPNTDQGYMVGDYVSTSFVGGNTLMSTAFGVFAAAKVPTGSSFHEAMVTATGGFHVGQTPQIIYRTSADVADRNMKPEHPMRPVPPPVVP
jgi:hypothetical protein